MVAELKGPSEENSLQIVPILQGYLQEARNARMGGLNPRDRKWEDNLHLYWNRGDHTDKAEWQSAVDLPEVPAFVDRFAAALKEALVTGPEGFYTVIDPADTEGDLTGAIKNMTDCWLSTCGRNQSGQCLGFPAVFEEQVKLGAIMGMCGTVLWKEDVKYGRVAIETTDPRLLWLDHTYRNLYRIRRVELDKHELRKMATEKDRRGKPIWNLDAIGQMLAYVEGEDLRRKEEMVGHGVQTSSTRQPIIMDEYLATVIGSDGKVLADNALMIVGNNQFLIRGPEKNPFWHGYDWNVYAPLVTVPFSVYGRSYMEDFGTVAAVFNNLTNLILDAVQMSSMKAFSVIPEMLTNPEQLADGITPNKVFMLEGGSQNSEFMRALDLGSLKPESFQIWQAMKNELREAADINEIGMGQFAPKGRTSATEVSKTQESSSAIIRSVAQTIETRWLNVILDLTWKTGLQHARSSDLMLQNAAGKDLYGALIAQRKELITRPISFQARGISMLIQKGRMLKSLMQIMAFLAQKPEMLAAFMQRIDLEKFLKMLFNLSDVDISKIEISERDRLIQSTAQQMQQGASQLTAGQPPPGPQAQQAAGDMAQTLGVAS